MQFNIVIAVEDNDLTVLFMRTMHLQYIRYRISPIQQNGHALNANSDSALANTA